MWASPENEGRCAVATTPPPQGWFGAPSADTHEWIADGYHAERRLVENSFATIRRLRLRVAAHAC
ncbi:hypothetical protein [Streptomyces sp. NPDC001568]|uniref:hypothetical protein n=1 Tax=Streptomyces sp. NPDC001568 TaxID=3364588 RepID=UPI003677B7B9